MYGWLCVGAAVVVPVQLMRCRDGRTEADSSFARWRNRDDKDMAVEAVVVTIGHCYFKLHFDRAIFMTWVGLRADYNGGMVKLY